MARIEGYLAPQAVSASGTKANLIKAYIHGHDGFLVKPVKRDVLTEKLRGLGIMKEQETSSPASYRLKVSKAQEDRTPSSAVQGAPVSEALPPQKVDDQ